MDTLLWSQFRKCGRGLHFSALFYSVKIDDYFDIKYTCIHSIHGSGENKQNVRKCVMYSYTVEHRRCTCTYVISNSIRKMISVALFTMVIQAQYACLKYNVSMCEY